MSIGPVRGSPLSASHWRPDAGRRCRRRRPAAGSCRSASATPADRPCRGGCCGWHRPSTPGPRPGSRLLAPPRWRGRHQLHQPARAGRTDGADVEAAFLPHDAQGERRIGRGAWIKWHRPAGCGSAIPSRPMRRATKTAASGMPAEREGGSQGAFGRDRREFVHPHQKQPGALRVAPGDQPGGGPHHLVAGESQGGIPRTAGVARLGASPSRCFAQRELARWP